MSTPSKAAIKSACERLSHADPALARAYKAIGPPVWRARPTSYETLATSVAYQLLSTKAASAIWGRVTDVLPDITPDTLLATDEETLRAAGLSRPKVAHLKSIATAIKTDALNLTRIASASIEDARKELLSVKGIGPWTANLYLLYALGKLDAFPAGDVALMEAHKQLSNAPARMDTKAFTAHAALWKPYRGVAAHLLWGWVNAQRSKIQTST